MTSSIEYWRRREEEQLRRNITEEAEYEKQVRKIYDRMMADIQKEIDAFYGKYAEKEGISMAAAKRRVAQLDIDAYAAKAKKYVAEKNLSKRANEEMRIYNLTMKVNRLEMLKAEIGIHLVDGFTDLDQYVSETLNGRTTDELKRQAGILGKTVSGNDTLVHSIVNASFHNATFSDRIWMHQALLKSELDKQLQQGLIAGKHPQVLARDIRKAFNVSRSDAERLMRTELARVQTDAQMRSFEENGFEWYMFLSLGSRACEVCRALNGKKFKVKDMLISENAPPMHPNCRCSTAAAMGDEEIAEIRGGEKTGSAEAISNTSERERAYAYIQDDGKREPGHVNLPLINTKKYHDKYDNLTRHKDVNESLYSESMKILGDRNNTEFEDIVAIDARTGDRLVKNSTAFANRVKHRCGFSRKEQNWLEERGWAYEVLHNHPNNSLPSRDDVRKLFERGKQSASTICCHNGDVYQLEKLKPFESIVDIEKKGVYLH